MTGGDFEGGLTVDLRVFSEGGRASIAKELNYSADLAITPFAAAKGAYESNENNKLENFLNATKGATIANTRLLLNPNITTNKLAEGAKLVAYDGNSLSENSDAKGANAYYDSNNNTAAINTAQTDNMTTKVAGVIAHEAIGHKVGGTSEVWNQNASLKLNSIGHKVGGTSEVWKQNAS